MRDPTVNRDDIIQFNTERDKKEQQDNVTFGPAVNNEVKEKIVGIVKKFWDCFCKEGAKYPVIGYKFSIDTGASLPICCPPPCYRIHKWPIMNREIATLDDNNWVYNSKSPWESMIILAPKPYQERMLGIALFVWRLCISYQLLNYVTLPFLYPIPCCNDVVNFIRGITLYFISLDARSGYHQVSVKELDQEKLTFFKKTGKKNTWRVMPFRPMNVPAFYTATMCNSIKEWNRLFVQECKTAAAASEDITFFHDETMKHVSLY